MAILQAKGIEKTFGDRQILRGCDLIVDAGECVGLVGINWAGKSTLLRIIANQLEADFGEVIRPVPVSQRVRDQALSYLSHRH